VYYSNLGLHGTYDLWVDTGSPDLLFEIRQDITELLSSKQPLALPDSAERELEFLEKRARAGV
jgi:hypothetical protein